MGAKGTINQHTNLQDTRQQSLFDRGLPSTIDSTSPATCDVVAIEKRRDGSTRYWCRAHRADATAKYGKPAAKCRGADLIPIRSEQITILDLDRYPGGVALWGAAPPVYDTTQLPFDGGIHVHARPTPKSCKEIDMTYKAVRIVGRSLPADGIEVNRNC